VGREREREREIVYCWVWAGREREREGWVGLLIYQVMYKNGVGQGVPYAVEVT
jgi:hypothetical protein